MKKLVINVICDCGEDVAEKPTAKDIFEFLLAARLNNVSLSKVADEIVALFESRPLKPEQRWMPAFGDAYYYVGDSGTIGMGTWAGYRFDEGRWEIGNIFGTPVDAEQARDRIKEVLLAFHKEH